MRKYILFGPKPEYSTMSWWENFMSGHINIGKRVTIFGENAMHWAINIRTTKWGVICFTLPVKTFGKYWGCHIYCSPNGTPWACTYYKSLWKEDNWQEELRARIRKKNFGHNFDSNTHSEALRALNNKFEWFGMTQYDIQKHSPDNENAWLD